MTDLRSRLAEILSTFRTNVSSVEELMRFDSHVVDTTVQLLEALQERLVAVHGAENSRLNVTNTLALVRNIRTNDSLERRSGFGGSASRTRNVRNRRNMNTPEPALSAYDQLYLYAGTRGRGTFILQHVVDAHGAQMATAETKPIAIVFALIGLFLHAEKGFTGLQVQQVHMQLGREKHQWPTIPLPAHRGGITAEDVLKVPEGVDRDAAISEWCRSVWEAYSVNRKMIVQLLQQHRVV